VRRGVTLVLLAAVGLATAPAAVALPSRIGTTSSLRGGPALVGDGAAWVDASPGRYFLRSRLPDGSIKTPRSGATVGDSDQSDTFSLAQRLSLRGSENRLMFSDDVFGGDQYHTERRVSVFTGSLAGSLGALSSCNAARMMGDPGPLSSGAVAVSANLVAYVDCQDRVVVRDLSPVALTRSLPTPTDPSQLALNGRWLAERVSIGNEIKIRVWDWMTGTPAYTTADADGFDLGPNGSLVTARPGRTCADGHLDLYTPEAPTGRRLAVTPCTADVVTGPGAVAVIAPAANGQRVLTLTGASNYRRDLALVGGRGVQAAPSSPEQFARSPAIDMDSSRAAFALKRCDGRQDLFTVSTANPGARRAVSSRCRVSILTRRSRLTRRNRLAFRLRCRNGCKGRVFLRIGRRGGRAARIAFPPSRRSRRIAFKISGSLPGSLRAGRGIAATLVARTTDLSGRKRVTRQRVRLSG
jgi:hypothetical protein